MTLRTRLAATLLLALASSTAGAANHELATVDSAAEVLQIFTGARLKGIPPELMRNAAGVAVIPHVLKAGLLVDRRFGRGVLLVHHPDGTWSHPLFVTLTGGGVGLEAGVESTDLVLIFKSKGSLERVLKGKGRLTLGADVAVAAGPVGKEIEGTAHGLRIPEIYSYSHSKGLFAGLSLEGDRLQVDGKANEGFYHIHGGHPTDVLALRVFPASPAVDRIKVHLGELCGVPAPTIVVTPEAHGAHRPH